MSGPLDLPRVRQRAAERHVGSLVLGRQTRGDLEMLDAHRVVARVPVRSREDAVSF
jgi:hypothetical protein